MSFSRKADSVKSFLGFIIPFLIMSPLFFIFSMKESWHKYGYDLNYIWAKIFFWVSGVKTTVRYETPLDRKQARIYAPNHSSFLDIPTMGLSNQRLTFVGKNSLEKVPIFGFMYRKLHITVDRESLRSSYSTLLRSLEAVDKGKNLVMFPEGGIRTVDPPNMTKFKDGPFRVAIEKQIPLVPVTIPYNWIALPDDGKFLLNRKAIKHIYVLFHKPIETTGMTIENLPTLKNRTFEIIEEELRKWNETMK